MFAHDLDWGRYPLVSRARGIVLGSLIAVGAAAALVSARTVATSYAVIAAAFLVAAWWRGNLADAIPRDGPVARHLSAFLLYAVASAAWAYSPATSFPSVLVALLVGLVTLAMMQLFAAETRANLLHMGEGLWIGYAVGVGYLLVELLSDQAVKIGIYNALGLAPGDMAHPEYFRWEGDTLVAISNEDLTRNIAPATLLLWPALTAMAASQPRRPALAIGLTILLAVAAVVLLGEHETSKLAFFVGVAALALARFALRFTGPVIAFCWVFACLAVLPLALIVHRLDVHESSWLQFTARHRIVIWNHTAERVLEAPWFGTGARTTYDIGPLLEKSGVPAREGEFIRSLSVHSHSVYLQTWFELGLVGAALLTLAGLAILRAIGALEPTLQPFAYATFATAAAMAASSYGMWQIWFVSMFGAAAAWFGLGASLAAKRSERVSA